MERERGIQEIRTQVLERKGRMQEIRTQLLAAGVIGGVVDDFVPLYKFSLLCGCGYMETSLGEEIAPDDMLSEPFILFDDDYNVLPDNDIFLNSIFILVMTDPETPGHEYLHWLNTKPFSSKPDVVLPSDSLLRYEAPTPTRSSKMVFTLFRRPCHPLIEPNSRENFSTRAFANENRLGQPMAAGFFYINIENENEHKISWTAKEKEDHERRISWTKCSTSYSKCK